jgi:hypothetical protein
MVKRRFLNGWFGLVKVELEPLRHRDTKYHKAWLIKTDFWFAFVRLRVFLPWWVYLF